MQAEPSPSSAAALPSLPSLAAVIVFGRDDAGKPHASRFDAGDAALAEKAAGLMGMRVLRVSTEEEMALAARLPAGRVFASGRAFVPFVNGKLFASLEEAAGDAVPNQAQGETCDNGPSKPQGGVSATEAAGAGDGALAPASGPRSAVRDWDGIDVGDVVLATTGVFADGWYEAVVVQAMPDDLFELRWRDYNEPHIVRRRGALGLLPPS